MLRYQVYKLNKLESTSINSGAISAPAGSELQALPAPLLSSGSVSISVSTSVSVSLLWSKMKTKSETEPETED